jgi:hypothetical protein
VRGSTKIKSDFTLYEDLLLEEHVLRLIGKETPLEVGLHMLKTERKIDWNQLASAHFKGRHPI